MLIMVRWLHGYSASTSTSTIPTPQYSGICMKDSWLRTQGTGPECNARLHHRNNICKTLPISAAVAGLSKGSSGQLCPSVDNECVRIAVGRL